MLRICCGFATVSPEVIGWSHGPTTVLMDCYGCATVLRRSLRLWHGLIGHTYIKSSAEQPLSTLSRCRRRGRLWNSSRKNKICCWLKLNSLQLKIHINQTKDKKKKKRRSVWAKDWLQRRVLHGQYEKLIVELREEDARGYKNYMRISSELFQELLERVGPKFDKKTPLWQISPHGSDTDRLWISYGAYGCVLAFTVIYGFLRGLTVPYGRNWNFWTCWK